MALGTTTTTNATTTNIIVTSRFFTNHTLVILIPTCVTGGAALRQGIEKMHFFRQDFDSASQTWTAVNCTYPLTAVTNNAPVVQTVFRTVTVPDILFTAADLTVARQQPRRRLAWPEPPRISCPLRLWPDWP